jgi:hypothetical protein
MRQAVHGRNRSRRCMSELNRRARIYTSYCLTVWLLLLSQICRSSGQPAPPAAAAAAAAAALGPAGAELQLVMPACTSAPTGLRIPRIIHRNYMEGRAAMYAATQVGTCQQTLRVPCGSTNCCNAILPSWQHYYELLAAMKASVQLHC